MCAHVNVCSHACMSVYIYVCMHARLRVHRNVLRGETYFTGNLKFMARELTKALKIFKMELLKVLIFEYGSRFKVILIVS